MIVDGLCDDLRWRCLRVRRKGRNHTVQLLWWETSSVETRCARTSTYCDSLFVSRHSFFHRISNLGEESETNQHSICLICMILTREGIPCKLLAWFVPFCLHLMYICPRSPWFAQHLLIGQSFYRGVEICCSLGILKCARWSCIPIKSVRRSWKRTKKKYLLLWLTWHQDLFAR